MPCHVSNKASQQHHVRSSPAKPTAAHAVTMARALPPCVGAVMRRAEKQSLPILAAAL